MGSKKYSTSVDIWSVGCIFAELITKKALFNGQSDEDQLDKIFRIMGTPSLEEWPEMADLPLYKADMPVYERQNLADFVPGLDEEGMDLLDKLLQVDPTKRITAADAMKHPFLKEVTG